MSTSQTVSTSKESSGLTVVVIQVSVAGEDVLKGFAKRSLGIHLLSEAWQKIFRVILCSNFSGYWYIFQDHPDVECDVYTPTIEYSEHY